MCVYAMHPNIEKQLKYIFGHFRLKEIQTGKRAENEGNGEGRK